MVSIFIWQLAQQLLKEIIVSSKGSSVKTGLIIRENSDGKPKLIVLITEPVVVERRIYEELLEVVEDDSSHGGVKEISDIVGFSSIDGASCW